MFSQERNFTDWQLKGFGSAPAFLFETIESTHSLMKQRAAAGEIPPGTLIVANTQTKGRGRHERTWDSPASKNLYFNILIPLDGIPTNHFAQITQITALTFAEVFIGIQEEADSKTNLKASTATETSLESNIEKTETATSLDNIKHQNITVKWPNDILYGKSKFCGILAEIVFTPVPQSPPKPALNMGIGINVNSNAIDYAHLGREVTTLKEIIGHPINREKLLQMLIGNLERAIGQFKAFGISPWVAAWKRMDKFIGTRGTIIINNHCTDANHNSSENSVKKLGTILDMQPDGSLLFQCDDGKIETVLSADLEI